jgi:hypothetical protein
MQAIVHVAGSIVASNLDCDTANKDFLPSLQWHRKKLIMIPCDGFVVSIV